MAFSHHIIFFQLKAYYQLSPSSSIAANLSYEKQFPMQHYGPGNKLHGYSRSININMNGFEIKSKHYKVSARELLNVSSLTSSNTRLTNLNESMRVRIISATGTPIRVKGSINHRNPNASCSGVVVVRQRLALWKTFQKKRELILRKSRHYVFKSAHS